MIIQKVMQYLTFTQGVSRYTVYRRPSSAMAALQLLPRTTAISCKSRLALTLEEQREFCVQLRNLGSTVLFSREHKKGPLTGLFYSVSDWITWQENPDLTAQRHQQTMHRVFLHG
jgi:hypothetical protein